LLVPNQVVTVTCTVPVPAGLVAKQVVVEAQPTLVADAVPKLTEVAPSAKFSPVRVTAVPPATGFWSGRRPPVADQGETL
jgi:hypothetical protein